MEINPYAPPRVERIREVDFPASDWELIRRGHLDWEDAIRAVGWVYLLLAAGLLVLMLVNVVSAPPQVRRGDATMYMVVLAIAVLSVIVGRGLVSLRPWGRPLGLIVGGIGLLAIPVGPFVNGYLLYLLLSAKGATVFTPTYREVIAATPQLDRSRVHVVPVLVLLVLAYTVFRYLIA